MKRKATELERLLARARAARPDDGADEVVLAPPGFATRVVALAWADQRDDVAGSLVQMLVTHGRRALVGSALLAVLSVAFNLPAVADAIESDMLAADDPITVVLDLSS